MLLQNVAAMKHTRGYINTLGKEIVSVARNIILVGPSIVLQGILDVATA